MLPKATAPAALERHRRLALQRLGVGHLSFADADAVHDDEVRPCLGVGRHRLQVVGLITRTPRPFICSKKLRLFTGA